MKTIEKYTGEKTYMFPSGKIATKERVLKECEGALTFTHIVETDEAGEIMYALQNLSAMCCFYGIDLSLTEEEKIAAIQEIVNRPVAQGEPMPSAEERTAAALEYIAMASMPDEEITEEA